MSQFLNKKIKSIRKIYEIKEGIVVKRFSYHTRLIYFDIIDNLVNVILHENEVKVISEIITRYHIKKKVFDLSLFSYLTPNANFPNPVRNMLVV